MKIRYYILILIIAGVFLYTAKNDVKTAYEHTLAYIQNSRANIISEISNAHTSSDSTVAINTSKTVETPGVLRAAGQFLGLNSSAKLTAEGVIALTNQQRHDNGNLPALKENVTLDATAHIKLEDMFSKQYFEHVSPSGVGVQNLADQEGYEYIIIGENLALGNFKDNAALVAAWMASPGHRANILNSKYVDIGVAVGQGTFNGEQTWLAVQHFGLPKSTCPSIDEVLHGVIDANQSQINTMSADMAVRRQQIDSGAVYDGMSTNEQIAAYNALIEQYNTLVNDTKSKINTYNAEVTAFNACIASATAGQATIK